MLRDRSVVAVERSKVENGVAAFDFCPQPLAVTEIDPFGSNVGAGRPQVADDVAADEAASPRDVDAHFGAS